MLPDGDYLVAKSVDVDGLKRGIANRYFPGNVNFERIGPGLRRQHIGNELSGIDFTASGDVEALLIAERVGVFDALVAHVFDGGLRCQAWSYAGQR